MVEAHRGGCQISKNEIESCNVTNQTAGTAMLEARNDSDCQRTSYRAYIDGLRAVAVLSVIVFHVSKKALPGGYLGVDIFFVISGYLITTVIWREAVRDEFSVARFYERRVRRIMPALICVLVVTSALCVAMLLPVDLCDYAKSVFASLGFVANVYFWRDANYFLGLAQEKPLLHLWSLGVEEQFYIAFPLLCMLCVRRQRCYLFRVTVCLVGLSLAANAVALYIGAGNPAFYLLPTRAWEIGAGCLLALAPARRLRGKWLQFVLGVLAAALLVIGLEFAGTTFSPPALPVAMWAVGGTALAIYLGEAAGDGWFTRLLESRVLVWIGLISYSLYLWHWPVLVFDRYYFIESDISLARGVFLFGLMLLLATLSWRYVEGPFRTRSMPVKRVIAWTGWGGIAVASLSIVALVSHGFPGRYSPMVARMNAAVDSEFRCGVRQLFPFGATRACMIGEPATDSTMATVALVGNSHAQMYAPLVSDILRQHGLAGILVPLNGCLPAPDYNQSTRCMRQAATNLKAIEALPRLRMVVLAMTWEFDTPMYTSAGFVPRSRRPQVFRDALDRLIQRLRREGKVVVLVGPVATPDYEAPSVVARQIAFHRSLQSPTGVSESVFINRYGDLIDHYSARSDMTFVRPDEAQCRNGECDYFREGDSLFADSNHLAQASLGLFRPVFDRDLARPLAGVVR